MIEERGLFGWPHATSWADRIYRWLPRILRPWAKKLLSRWLTPSSVNLGFRTLWNEDLDEDSIIAVWDGLVRPWIISVQANELEDAIINGDTSAMRPLRVQRNKESKQFHPIGVHSIGGLLEVYWFLRDEDNYD